MTWGSSWNPGSLWNRDRSGNQRSSRNRRSTLAYLTVLRGASSYHLTARHFHGALGLVALALVIPSVHVMTAVPVVLVALGGPTLNYLLGLQHRGWLPALPPLRRVAESLDRRDGRHQLNLPALLEILGLMALVVVFSWIVTDLSAERRLFGLLVAVAFTLSVAHAIYSDHTWFNPAETDPPRWHEALRSVAGLSTALLVAGIALPGQWTASERGAVTVIAALPLIVGVRLRDMDQTIAVLAVVVDDERRRGRQLVVDETERALSRPLAELEQLAQQHRGGAGVLLDLATHARSRLQETLATANQPPQHPPTIDELLGPVLTLARAIGVSVQVTLELGGLSEKGLTTAVWVLRDLVGNAINADGSVVEVTAWHYGGSVVLTVSDDAAPMPSGVWKAPGTSSARLERHLILLGGLLEMERTVSGKVVTARFLDVSGATAGDDGGINEHSIGQGASG